MLTIRAEQMEVFERYALDEFKQRVIARLTETFAQQFGELSHELRRQFVDTNISRGQMHGLENEDDLVMFAEAAVQLGTYFDEPRASWAGTIMCDLGLGSPSERIAYVIELISTQEES